MICQVTTPDFPQWLEDQLKIKGWIQADLAQRSGIDDSVLSRIINRERQASSKTLKKIASALHLNEEEVFRAAGELPTKQINDRAARITNYFLQLPDRDQEIIETMLVGLLQQRDQRGENNAEALDSGANSKTQPA